MITIDCPWIWNFVDLSDAQNLVTSDLYFNKISKILKNQLRWWALFDDSLVYCCV
jgi:hypothetical protein